MGKNNKGNFFKSERFKIVIAPEIFRVFIVFVSTIIYGIGLGWFIQVSEVRMYGGGVPGIAQLLVDMVKVTNMFELTPAVEDTMMFLTIIIVNIPIIFLGWFGVSKRFTIYSIISVILQATIISYFKWDVFEGVDPILLSIFGGVLIGVGVGIAMKFGTSTGGFDIVSQYISLKRGRSVGQISTLINIFVMGIGAVMLGFGPDIIVDGKIYAGAEITGLVLLYTLLRLFITMLTIDKVHTSYNYIEFSIITENGEEMAQEIIKNVQRGVTIFDARGGYSFNEKTMVYLIVMRFEKHKLIETIKNVDPNAFIITKAVSSINGNFSKKTVA